MHLLMSLLSKTESKGIRSHHVQFSNSSCKIQITENQIDGVKTSKVPQIPTMTQHLDRAVVLIYGICYWKMQSNACNKLTLVDSIV